MVRGGAGPHRRGLFRRLHGLSARLCDSTADAVGFERVGLAATFGIAPQWVRAR